jgi:hypothetical protein
MDDARSPDCFSAVLIHALEMPPSSQSPLQGKTPHPEDRALYPSVARVAESEDAHALRRLRPLLRRRLRIVRPARVAMRFRKPWSRLRLMLLG